MTTDPAHRFVKIHPAKLPVIAVFLLAISISFSTLFAQAKVTSALVKQDTTETIPAVIDTMGFQAGKITVSSERDAKSGSLAMLLSAVLPGAGQLYAHRYYTIPLIWGCGIYFTSIAIKSNDLYNNYRDQYSASVDSLHTTGDSRLLDIRDKYRDQRDEFILYLALTYFLNIIDAYVGATLYSFDVSDELGGSAALKLRVPIR